MEPKKSKLSLWTLVMLIFVPTFGFSNITNNGVALGPASIPSWLLVCVFYFLPLTAFIAELASANQDKGGGIYSWIECSLGEKWAFVGTWSYYIAGLFYLQFVFSRIPVVASWAIFGENKFSDHNVAMLPYIGIALCIALTWMSTKGVQKFSKISNIGGKFTLAATVLFIVFAIIGYFTGTPTATEFSPGTVIPEFNTTYFATFSWLLFAVAGAEVAGTYINKIDKPKRNFPRGVFIATFLVGGSYVIGSLAMCLVASPQVLTEAGLKDANYIVYKILAENWGLNGKLVVQLYSAILTITSVAAYILWIESPIRAMFCDVPKGTFPKYLTKKDDDGTLSNALWTQCVIVVALIGVPLVGLKSIDAFFRLITDLSALSLVVPYIILTVAYFAFRYKKQEAPFTMFKSNNSAYIVASTTLLIGIAGFIGAGLDSVIGAETNFAALKAIFLTYGGPVILIIAGYSLRLVMRSRQRSQEKLELLVENS
jgi:amino acid transporter